MRIEPLQKLIIEGNAELGAAVTFDAVILKPIDHGKQIVGQPRLIWCKETMADLWKETKSNTPEFRFVSALKLDNPVHINEIRTYAEQCVQRTK